MEGCVAVYVFFCLLAPPLPWPLSVLPAPPSGSGLAWGRGVPRWRLLVLVPFYGMERLPVAAVVAEVDTYIFESRWRSDARGEGMLGVLGSSLIRSVSSLAAQHLMGWPLPAARGNALAFIRSLTPCHPLLGLDAGPRCRWSSYGMYLSSALGDGLGEWCRPPTAAPLQLILGRLTTCLH